MSKFFKTPFAQQGDKEVIPLETQLDNSVSYTNGYGIEYETDNIEGTGKPLPRPERNSLMYDITEAIGEKQQYGFPKWSTEGKPYPVNTVLYHGDNVFISLKDGNNVTPVNGANWKDITSVLVNAIRRTDLNTSITKLNEDTDSGLTTKASKDAQLITNSGLLGGGNLTTNRTISVDYGTTAGKAAIGNDVRINNGQTAFEQLEVGLEGKIDKTTKIIAGKGLLGGGTLDKDLILGVRYGTGANSVASGADPRFNNPNKVYTGTDANTLEYPIGHMLVAWYGSGTPAFNTHCDMFNSTYGTSGNNRYVFVSDFMPAAHKGTKLNGRWTFVGYASAPQNTYSGFFIRIS